MSEIPAIDIRVVDRSWVIENPDKVNTTNHGYSELPVGLQAIEEAISRPEYYRRLTETWFDIWKPILQRMQLETKTSSTASLTPVEEGKEVILSPSVCQLLKSAADGGVLLQRIPKNLEEDLRDQVLPLMAFLEEQTGSNPMKKYFVRLNDCSPKDGIGGHGPFSTAWSVLLSLCTSSRAQKALRDLLECGAYGGNNEDDGRHQSDAREILHLLPWREEISTVNEFRIFVPPNGKVRAISQYSERSGGWADDVENDYAKIKSLVPRMIQCNTRFRALAQEAGLELPKGGYVLDVHVQTLHQKNGNTTTSEDGFEWLVEPIEINPFGAQLASGSGIFQWLRDWECMYGFSENVIVALVYEGCREDNNGGE